MTTLTRERTVGDLNNEIDNLKDQIASANSEIRDLEERLEEKIVEADQEITDAVNAFLDLVERPVGTRDFNIPKTDAVKRAIIGMHDAIGRGL